MDHEIGILRVLLKPFVGVRIATENELEAIPRQTEAHWPIQRVDGGPGSNGNAVILVYDLISAP